jgi:DNA polymerase I-like protein with 3'-5' exonuclease and polymerase domains
MKELQRIIDSDTLVYKSYAVACLMPEKVNTKMSPLIWKAGLVRGPDVVTDERLRPYCQQVRLIVKGNYEQAKAWMADRLKESPQVALDIETSTPDESDEWLMGDDKKVDVLGSKLTGMGLTFGANGQYTFYFSVDHKDTDNVTSEEVADIVATIKCPILVQNFGGFEGPILYRAWGERLKDNGWHGFLPNVIDTKVLANYTDENVSSGLKQNTELYTGYKQVTYDQVTSKEGTVGTLTGGRVVAEWKVPVMVETLQRIMDPETEQWNEVPTTINKLDDNGDPVFIYMERRRYKMNQLTGKEVLAYGADDTICTTALYQHYRLRMEIEGSWQVAMELEQAPMYVTALAFVNGTVFSQQTMKEQEQEDQIKADAAWAVIREYLISIGWEGSVCPVFKELDAANIKTAVAMLLPGVEFKTQVRTPAKLAILVEALEHPDAANLAKMITLNEVEAINAWMASVFDGEPVLDLNSPKQMKAFLYDTLKLPVRLVNPCTPLEFKEKPALSKAISKFKKIANGSQSVEPLTEEELELVKKKARTDDTSMDFALAFDVPDHPVLKALKEMKTCGTRQSLFYTPYRKVRHWVDGKIHAQANLTSTVTRRAAPSSPNLAQLPKRGEGVKFRRCFLPHHPNAVMVSVDSSGQELRLQAGLSKDPEMLSCYVGDNLRDLHSITASGAMRVVWSKTAYDGAMASLGNVLPPSDYETFLALLKSPDKGVAKQAKDLRTLSKGVNFGSAYGCEAPKMQELLVTDLETATNMLEAKLAKFCGYEVWKEKVEEQAMTEGLVRTELGGIRHLAHVMSSENRGERERAARQASNFKIQSAGAELAKKALTHIWNSGILFRYDCVFFALIHDECVLSVHRDHAVEVIKVVQAAMSLPYTPTFPVPFIGSVSLGLNFGDQIECGDGFFPDRIRAALAECFPERLAA